MNKLYPLIISAPFGNYLSWPCATSTLGTFTREYRGGFWKRVWRVLCTVRYYHGMEAWTNSLGLPNPGIDSVAVKEFEDSVKSQILSVSARKTDDWFYLLDKVKKLGPFAVELNVSCPNCPGEPDHTNYDVIFKDAVDYVQTGGGIMVIVKLPPFGYEQIAAHAVEHGIQALHCCNTLPTPAGGLSGKPLKHLSLQAVRYCSKYRLSALIGGGGITCWDDILDYKRAGATNFAVASALFFPWRWRRFRDMAELLERERNILSLLTGYDSAAT